MRSESIQKRLLTEAKLTLAKALEIGQGIEAAAVKAKEFKDAPRAVMQVQAPRHRSCYRCGRNNHDQGLQVSQSNVQQLWKSWVHSPCLSITQESATEKSKISTPKPRAKFVEIEQEAADDSPVEDLTLFTVGARSSNPIEMAIQIND